MPGERTAGFVGDGDRDHDGQAEAELLENLVDGEERGLCIERVEDGFNQQEIDPAFDERLGLFGIGGHKIVEGDRAKSGVVHIRRHRSRTVGRPDGPRHKQGAGGILLQNLFHGTPGHLGPFDVELIHQRFQVIVGLRDDGAAKGVGLDNVRARFKEFHVDLFDELRTGEGEQVVVSLQVGRMVSKAFSAKVGLFEFMLLDHGAHGAIEHQHLRFQ